ncbi:MAG: hypothetical protein HUK22_02785, partial [Thermoguttaceae bacterium]|nr:hypothetical protein [Thermoguttaceae bacterium]
YLEMLYRASEANRKPYPVTLVATVPALRKVYTWSQGVLKSATSVANGKKVLDPTSWTFDFAKLSIVNY